MRRFRRRLCAPGTRGRGRQHRRSPAFTAALREHLDGALGQEIEEQALREHLDGVLGQEIEEQLEHYVRWRERVRRSVSGFGSRERLWRELRAAGLYGVLRSEGAEAAGRLVDDAIARHQAGASDR